MQTILIVDDDPALTVAWGRILHLKNFRVATARDAEAGLAAASELRPALIVTDLDMPGTDGIEFCRQLKRDPKLAKIPVVLASAGREPALRELVWDMFWQKPVPADVMLESIKRLLASAC